MALFSLRDIRVAFGGPPLLAVASLKVEPGDRICLLRRNGTGNSTLLKVVNGEIEEAYHRWGSLEAALKGLEAIEQAGNSPNG